MNPAMTRHLQTLGLERAPFPPTPDAAAWFQTTGLEAELAEAAHCLRTRAGFVLLTGEVGTGKTLLCRRLLQALPENAVSAYLPNPYLAPRTLLLALAEELGVAVDSASDDYHLLKCVNEALLAYAGDERPVVVCIDEAQAMPLETLEALRLLSNLETEKRKLLQIVLFGQPELDEKLNRPEVRQLRQRIAFHYRLGGLRKSETGHYVAHRLRVAGYLGEGLFTPAAVRALHRASGGTPRLINILAHKSLLCVFGEGRQLVKLRHVRLARKDTEGARRVGWFWG